ncbi:tetratricopeptide repeat protein [bacterium]|nr:tetratricopeptide repeat protein [bacterium]
MEEEKNTINTKLKKKHFNFLLLFPWILLLITIGGFAYWYITSQKITTTDEENFTALVNNAQKSVEEHKYADAIKTYYSAIGVIQTKIEPYEGIVDIYLTKNDPESAESVIKDYVLYINNADKSTLYYKIGNYYYEKADYSKAEKMYNSALSMSNETMNVEMALGRTYLKEGEFTKAKNMLSQSGYSDDNLSEATLLLSYIESISDIEKAKETVGGVYPTSKWSLFFDEMQETLNSLTTDEKFNATKLARLFINRGYPHLAVEALGKYADSMDEYPDGLYFLGRAYLDTSRYDDALAVLTKAQALGENLSGIFWAEGRAYYKKNDLDNTMKAYSYVVEESGTNLSKDLYTEYITFLMDNKQYASATTSISTVSEKVSDPYISLLGAKCAYKSGDLTTLTSYLDKVSASLTSMSLEERKAFWYLRIREHLANSLYDMASSELKELLALDKYNPEYYLLMGEYLLTQEGQVNAARDNFQLAIDYDCNNSVTEEAKKKLGK